MSINLYLLRACYISDLVFGLYFLLERTVVTLGPGQKLSYSLLITMMVTAIMATTFRVFAMCRALYTLVAESLPGPGDHGYSGTD